MKSLYLLCACCLLVSACGGANEAVPTTASNLPGQPVQPDAVTVDIGTNEAARGSERIKLPVVKAWWDDFFKELQVHLYEREPEVYSEEHREEVRGLSPDGVVSLGITLLDRPMGLGKENIKRFTMRCFFPKGHSSNMGVSFDEAGISELSGGSNKGDTVHLVLDFTESDFYRGKDAPYRVKLDVTAKVLS